MPYIKAKEIEKLIEIENHLGEMENWSENTLKMWDIIETLQQRQKLDAEKSKHLMRTKRALNKNYGRAKS